MTVIKIPKTPKSAYNPKRDAGALLKAQLDHLEHAAGVPTTPKRRLTEGAAAKRIAELTARLSQPAAPIAAAPPPVPARPSVRKAAKRKSHHK